MTDATTLPAENPFASRSTLPYELPPFAEIREEHYRPALEAGLAAERAEVEAIASNPEAPTFENTIVAFEQTGQLLHRVTSVLYNLSSSDSSPFLEQLEEEFAPRFSAHTDETFQDARLAARVEAVAADPSLAERSEEDRRLVDETLKSFKRSGASLDDATKARVSEINARLSSLSTSFEQNLLADTNDLALVLDSREELAGLADGEIEAAAAAAKDRGLDGRFVISLVLPTSQPHLASLERRDVRERLWKASAARGSRGNQWDNRAIALEMAQLGAEKAELLGYASHSAYIAERATAGTPEAIQERLTMLAAPAARNAAREQEQLQALVDEEQAAKGEPSFTLEPWDWAFYSEKIRARDYQVDTAAMRPFFEAERVLQDGVFGAASRIYGIRFEERKDLVGYHPEVRVFEVTDEDGSPVGLYLLDLYTRDSKRGGAWMNDFVQQNRLEGTPTVVVNNLNVPKPPAGTPTLLTFDEVNTLFHEFGHALHGLFAQVTYPSFGGTSVPRDFVEFPSQVNEMWMLWPEVVEAYAKHVETGEALPKEQIDRLRAASIWGEGFATSEYLAAAILDQAWHSLSAEEAKAVTDVAEFERKALADAGLDNPAVPTRYSTPYFQHIFAGGYSAGYYGYIWSEVLDADTVKWFEEHGGATRENGQRFRERLLGVGGAKDPLEAYRDFRGRDAEIEPLLERRGLTA
ncbi:Dipeptidyl carboxypeptidase [Pseudoclavibacter triregionum]|nr:Dipeptidyl carboxypeptidase [Pseudoclavibacter triregionum]